MSLIDRWLEDSKHPFFWFNDPKTGEQKILDGHKIINLTPDDPRWEPIDEDIYYAHHPEAKKLKKNPQNK
ncbi:hypothetical protein [Jonquetella anthropi]|uniref:hypothetical protein n=1 Tax=Jonquetella anthropi TaxID=428712 RepID=UPI0001B90F30|nr:hypothetical protein [Jonquetella anthropi]EEX48696.1 hypothetical protein GCWU000246_00722 [Jonquetella anthropi E3_33 E1]